VNARTTKSTFGTIYLQLALLAVFISAGFATLGQFFIAPFLVEDRIAAITSVLRSHSDDLLLHKTRAVRDELIRSGAISNDGEFDHFLPDETAMVRNLLHSCRFITPTVCLGEQLSIFFNAEADQNPPQGFQSAVLLRSNLSKASDYLYLWDGIVALVAAAAMLLLQRSIARKERYLLNRLAEASQALRSAQVLFGGQEDSADEFEAFSRSTRELVTTLEEYKARFERRTRLEQLGITIGQVSHDLKAPLNEAENFLSSLPMLLDSVPRDQLQEAIDSLLARVRAGRISLTRALRVTKQLTVAREKLDISELLSGLLARTRQLPKLCDLTVSLSVDSKAELLGDRIRLETAFLNLLDNTAEEKPDAHVNVSVRTKSNGSVVIFYEDNGRGLPPDSGEKIFEPLITFKADGTGLGLSSTREILLQHGGSIRAITGKAGAAFEIRLPAAESGHA
jgi:signal transduction histidine kinase